MSEQLRCTVRFDGDVVTVHPSGHLDLRTATELRSVLHKALAVAPTAIIVDMADLVVDDDICLTLFPALARHAAGDPGTWVLACGAGPPAAAAFFAMGIDRSVPLYTTWEEASRLAQTQASAPRRSCRLPADLRSPAQARSFVAAACTDWNISAGAVERLQVIATELVANAVVHAGTPSQLVLRRSRRHIHVVVIDEDPRLAALRGPDLPRSMGGRGLMLVDAFAAAWGCTPTANGKSTWATVRYLPPP